MINNHTNTELEGQILGNLILYPHLISENHSRLHQNLFTDPKNYELFRIIWQTWKNLNTIDLPLLGVELNKQKRDDLLPYAVKLCSDATSLYNMPFHLMILAQLSAKRDFISRFTHLLHIANQVDNDIFDIRKQAFESFNELFLDRFIDRNKTQQNFSDLVEKVQQKFETIQQGKHTGIASSLPVINKAFGGWQNSDLTIVAGRPAMGKTAFLIQQVVDCVLQNKSVGIFSLEMSAEQIAGRVITNFAEIPNSSLLRKGLNQQELQQFLCHKKTLQEMKIFIDDTPAISIENLSMKAKMMKFQHEIDILFVDYLQLITHSKSNNRENEISTISRNLKAIAKELNIPVIALSQLSRNVEQRADKRPMLSDLRESGAIEQDADEVLFLYRPEYYGIDFWGQEYNYEKTHKQAEIIIQKNRHGGTLSERCSVDLAQSRFSELLKYEL